MKKKLILAMAGSIAALALASLAHASLGGDVDSVRDDQTKLQGTVQMTSSDSYDVHEIHTLSGVTLREYVARSGNVFAVAWQGRSHPDLRQVLGASYDAYVQAVQTQRALRHGHGPLLIQQPGLVIQVSGHMGSLVGRAYLPQGLPAGVRAENIR